MYHGQLLDFLVRFGGGNDPLNFQNRAIGGFWENARFIRSNGRKTTFEWPKVVSEVISPRFWGVVLCCKVFSEFWNCDRRCRFWDVPFLHKKFSCFTPPRTETCFILFFLHLFSQRNLREPTTHQPWGLFEIIQKDFWFWLSLGGHLAYSVLSIFTLQIFTRPSLSPAMRRLSENLQCRNARNGIR